MVGFFKVSVITGLLSLSVLPVAWADTIYIYTSRQPFLLEPIIEAFEQSSGIDVQTVYAKKGLLERLRIEGSKTRADIIMTSDAGDLDNMARAGVLQPIQEPMITDLIPADYRHPENMWIGLSRYVRALFVVRDKASHIATYDDLLDAKWQSKICMRPARQSYNITLIAAMLVERGEPATRRWLEGVKANLARKPQGNDRSQARAIKNGLCWVTLMNSYYLGKMITNDQDLEQKKWAQAGKLVFPDQDGSGAYIGLTGVGISRSTKNMPAVMTLIRFLISKQGQQLYAKSNFEYPARPDTPPADLVSSWGDFIASDVPFYRIVRRRPEAVRLIEEVGFDY